MGRPERNTVDYFPHFIGNGKKIFTIEAKYGNDGYAVWFKILEKLAGTDYHFLNLTDESELIYLAAKCHIEEERLIAIINDLCRLGVFDKKAWKNRIIWSQQFIDSIIDVYDRRNNKCMNYDSLCLHLIGLGIHLVDNNSVNDNNNTQTKLNYTKLNKTKIQSEIDLAFDSFIEMRKKIKKPPTLKAIELLKNKLKRLAPENEDLQIKILEQSILNCWQDIFPIRQDKKNDQKESKSETLIKLYHGTGN